MSETLVLLGIVVAASSGAARPVLRARTRSIGQWVTTLLAVLGAGLGLAGVGSFWATGDSRPIVRPWSLPGAEFSVAMDGLSAIFLRADLPDLAAGQRLRAGLLEADRAPARTAGSCGCSTALLTAGMALLVIARNSILFLFGWEIMALSAFFLVTTEDDEQEVREAGWLYLVATHVATLCLFALFALLRAASGSFTLDPADRRTA